MVFANILSSIGLFSSLVPKEQPTQNPTLLMTDEPSPEYGILFAVAAIVIVTFLAIKYLK